MKAYLRPTGPMRPIVALALFPVDIADDIMAICQLLAERYWKAAAWTIVVGAIVLLVCLFWLLMWSWGFVGGLG